MGDQRRDQSIASIAALDAGYERWHIVVLFANVKDQVYRAGRPFTFGQIMEFGDVDPIDGDEFDPFKVNRGLITVFPPRKA